MFIPPAHRRLLLALSLGGYLAVLAAAALALTWLPRDRTPGAALGLLACLPWIGVLARRHQLSPGAILLVALLGRLMLLPTPPVLSDDLHRYVWDGTVALSGRNPMSEPPTTDALELLRGQAPGWERINHPQLSTIYPPLAQGLFAVGVALARGTGLPPMVGIKVLLVGADLTLCLLLAALLRRRKRPDGDLCLYALNPLVLLEVAGSGHVDPLMWALAYGSFLLLEGRGPGTDRTRTLVAGALLGLAVLAKLFAAVALLFLLRRRRDWLAAGVTLLVTAAGFAPLAFPVGDAPLASYLETLQVYGATWRHNESIFVPVEELVRWVGQIDVEQTGPTYLGLVTRGVLALPVGLLALLYLWRGSRRHPDRLVESGTALLAGAFIWTSPVVHPWYILWILPAATLRARAGWLWLGSLALATYMAPGEQVPWWVRLLEYLPAAVLLVWAWRPWWRLPPPAPPG